MEQLQIAIMQAQLIYQHMRKRFLVEYVGIIMEQWKTAIIPVLSMVITR